VGYYLQAIVGRRELLARHLCDYAGARLVDLEQGLALIPMTDELFDEIGSGVKKADIFKYSEGVAKWLVQISSEGPVAYIEAEYFGGAGGQNAAFFQNHKETLFADNGSGNINAVLRLLGAEVGVEHDEFEAVGLPRHRDMDDWIAEATRPT